MSAKEDVTFIGDGTASIKDTYNKRMSVYKALQEEVTFILNEMTDKIDIKIHDIESRIKDLPSTIEKMTSKASESIDELTDIVGCRVICLFKSDLSKIEEFIVDHFDIINRYNKIDVASDSFGYMSIHYTCKMKKYTGPRYSKICNQIFEIQTRTLCMHAWAAISHYLDYKTETDIPDNLKKGLNALSGLFYVADSQYEQLYHTRENLLVKAKSYAGPSSMDQSINFDTVKSLVERLFPERSKSNSDTLSKFVTELHDNKYRSIVDVERQINSVKDDFVAKDHAMAGKKGKSGQFYFTDVGACRTSLGMANSSYALKTMGK